jgi:hypothetical protein
MLDIIMIILILFAILLMIYAIEKQRIAFTLLDSIMWLIIALFILQGIEIPYQLYNVSANKIQTGVQLVQTNLIPLSYLFMALGLLMFILTVTFILEAFADLKKLK